MMPGDIIVYLLIVATMYWIFKSVFGGDDES